MTTKHCTGIHHAGPRELPFEQFIADTSSDDGYGDLCEKCRAFESEKVKNRALARAKVEIRSSSPHLSDLAEELLKQGGNVEKVAKKFWNECKAAKPGLQRLKFYQELFKVITENTRGGYADKPIEDMTSEDLDKYIEEVSRTLIEKKLAEQATDDPT